MDRVEEAQRIFEGGFSCSQAVVASFADRWGVDREMAFAMARCFGAGMGLGLTCGAVTGSFMVLGLAAGKIHGNNQEARYATYAMAKEFRRRFESRWGTIECKGLLGVDLGTAEGYQEAKDRGLFLSDCPRFVRTATEILEEMLSAEPGKG